MKAFLPLTLAMLIGFSLLHADTDKEALGKLTARIGDKFWSPPEKRLVRATIYGKGADDGKSDEKISLRYAHREGSRHASGAAVAATWQHGENPHRAWRARLHRCR